MFCTRCGSSNEDSARFCSKCGAALAAPAAASGKAEPRPSTEKPQEAGRGATILTLGIFSVVLLGLMTGIPAWVMGHNDLRKIKAGVIDARQRGMTRAGMILGIIGTFGVLAAILAVMLVVSGTILATRLL